MFQKSNAIHTDAIHKYSGEAVPLGLNNSPIILPTMNQPLGSHPVNGLTLLEQVHFSPGAGDKLSPDYLVIYAVCWTDKMIYQIGLIFGILLNRMSSI